MLGFEPWDSTATDYTALGQQIKDSGAESVYLGGIVCNNGVKLLKDIRSVVGSKPVFVGSGRLDPVLGYRWGRVGGRRACTSATRACRSRSSARRARRSWPG